MDRVILLATGNKDKIVELRELLDGLPWDVKSPENFPHIPEPVEDGDTFEENAVIKADYSCDHFGLLSVADDSGLVVDALDGAPGIFSARYTGEGCTYADNNVKLLDALKDVPVASRTARFVCCAALVRPDANPIIEAGTVEGRIGFECIGVEGFGYDPLFIPDGFEQTFAEMELSQKQTISHRACAFKKIRKHLEVLS